MQHAERHAVWITAAVMAASLLAATVMAADTSGPHVAACTVSAAGAGKPACKTAGRCRFTGQLP